jgi:hypothetical protein
MSQQSNALVLPANTDVDSVEDEIIGRHIMPPNARLDALHVATAALAGVHFRLDRTTSGGPCYDLFPIFCRLFTKTMSRISQVKSAC